MKQEAMKFIDHDDIENIFSTINLIQRYTEKSYELERNIVNELVKGKSIEEITEEYLESNLKNDFDKVFQIAEMQLRANILMPNLKDHLILLIQKEKNDSQHIFNTYLSRLEEKLKNIKYI